MDRDREKDLRDAAFALRHPYSSTATKDTVVLLQEALPCYITKLISTEAELQKAQAENAVLREALETVKRICPHLMYPTINNALSSTAGQAFPDEMRELKKENMVLREDFEMRMIMLNNAQKRIAELEAELQKEQAKNIFLQERIEEIASGKCGFEILNSGSELYFKRRMP